MELWQTLRKVLVSATSCVKPPNTGNGDGGSGDNGANDACEDGGHVTTSFLNLRNDVQSCGYEDVQVMWKILSQLPPEEVSDSTECSNKQRQHRWRAFLWFHQKMRSTFK